MPSSEDMIPGVYRRIFSGALHSRRLAILKPLEAELLFWRIIMIADDYGRFRAGPTSLLSTAFPLRPEIGVRKIKRWRDTLVKAKVRKVGLIVLYKIDGETFGYVVGWKEKQTTRSGRRVMRFPAPKNAGRKRKPGASGGKRGAPKGSGGKPGASGGRRIASIPSSSSSSRSSSLPRSRSRSSPSSKSVTASEAPAPVLGDVGAEEGGGSGTLGDEEKRIEGFKACNVCEPSGEYAGAVIWTDGQGKRRIRLCSCPRGENRKAALKSIREETRIEEAGRAERQARRAEDA